MNTLTTIQKYNWKRFYSLSTLDYTLLFKDQKGLCAICHLPEGKSKKTGKQRMLSVDHNHKTKQVRGLLCRKCNLLLGCCKEDIKVLLASMCYLKKFNKLTTEDNSNAPLPGR